jgi:hypothetical protein
VAKFIVPDGRDKVDSPPLPTPTRQVADRHTYSIVANGAGEGHGGGRSSPPPPPIIRVPNGEGCHTGPAGYLGWQPGRPVRQPYAGDNYIPHSETMNLATDLQDITNFFRRGPRATSK